MTGGGIIPRGDLIHGLYQHAFAIFRLSDDLVLIYQSGCNHIVLDLSEHCELARFEAACAVRAVAAVGHRLRLVTLACICFAERGLMLIDFNEKARDLSVFLFRNRIAFAVATAESAWVFEVQETVMQEIRLTDGIDRASAPTVAIVRLATGDVFHISGSGCAHATRKRDT
jgi:hypothetical protein